MPAAELLQNMAFNGCIYGIKADLLSYLWVVLGVDVDAAGLAFKVRQLMDARVFLFHGLSEYCSSS